ncbi:MAG TPA: ureidoglycolate lyase [Rhodospirillales bacterium]|nr:ureidoglycolate lyase [Rhodospirillales bacterium]
MSPPDLRPEPLTRKAFAPFGEVIETQGAASYPINEGTTERFHDLAAIDVAADDGRTLVNIFRGQARDFPCQITMMERHPLGSQAFIPLDRRPYLVVVAATPSRPGIDDLYAFFATGDQGVNYRKGIWHHPLLCMDKTSDFLVIDRGGAGQNLEEIWFDKGCRLVPDP